MTSYTKSSTEYCDICGNPATGGWHGMRSIGVCAACAEESLPALLVDATPITTHEAANRVLEKMTLRFWRALAIKLMDRRPGGGAMTTTDKPRWPNLLATAIEFRDMVAVLNLARAMATRLDQLGIAYEGTPEFPNHAPIITTAGEWTPIYTEASK